MILTQSDLQQLFLDGGAFADPGYQARCAAAMPFVAEEVMRRRREADDHARQLLELDREIVRLRRVIADQDRLNAAGAP